MSEEEEQHQANSDKLGTLPNSLNPSESNESLESEGTFESAEENENENEQQQVSDEVEAVIDEKLTSDSVASINSEKQTTSDSALSTLEPIEKSETIVISTPALGSSGTVTDELEDPIEKIADSELKDEEPSIITNEKTTDQELNDEEPSITTNEITAEPEVKDEEPSPNTNENPLDAFKITVPSTAEPTNVALYNTEEIESDHLIDEAKLVEALHDKPEPPILPPRDEEPIMINTEDVPTETQLETENDTLRSAQQAHTTTSVVGNINKWFAFGKSETSLSSKLQGLSQPENFSLALLRFHENKDNLLSRSQSDQQSVNSCAESLRKTFNEIKTSIEFTNDEKLIQGINWEFWSSVVNDYDSVVKNQPDELSKLVSQGIPRELRGMVWQLICNSKSSQLEEFYRNARNLDSDYEKLIKRDLARTSFVTNSAVKSRIDDLFEIIKVYSLFDSEVGYTQGMAFITVPLLMNMDANESFCMLVNLMKNYGFRDLYLPEMTGLHIKLYQFDRLLEDLAPDLHIHLKRQGVRSSMYATQWFLTLFGYKFPLEMVLRIYDFVIYEGIESILKFAVNLMIKNQEHLLKLTFDDLLAFLKDKLFFYYVDNSSKRESFVTNSTRHLTDAYSNKEITIGSYKLEEFVNDSMAVNILPITLKRYEAEYEEINRLERERQEEIEELRTRNGQLTRDIRKVEAAYATLNREHVDIANEMVQGKVLIANLQDENQQLVAELKEMTERLEHLDKQSDRNLDFTGEISENMQLEIQKTMQRNLEVMEENRLLEEQLNGLEQQYSEIKKELDEAKGSAKWLKKKAFW